MFRNQYKFTNPFNLSDDVYIIDTNNNKYKTNNHLGISIPFIKEGIYKFRYIVNDEETFCPNKLFMIENEKIYNYILIIYYQPTYNYLIQSAIMNDLDAIYLLLNINYKFILSNNIDSKLYNYNLLYYYGLEHAYLYKFAYSKIEFHKAYEYFKRAYDIYPYNSCLLKSIYELIKYQKLIPEYKKYYVHCIKLITQNQYDLYLFEALDNYIILLRQNNNIYEISQILDIIIITYATYKKLRVYNRIISICLSLINHYKLYGDNEGVICYNNIYKQYSLFASEIVWDGLLW